MEGIYQNFRDNVDNLLRLTNENTCGEQVVFKSAIVFLIASWEKYVESVLDESVRLLIIRMRNSTALPIKVKQSVSLGMVARDANDNQFSEAIWALSDDGWRSTYEDYCHGLTGKLNTASPENINKLTEKIIGVRNISSQFQYDQLTNVAITERLNKLINLRNEIAHGVIDKKTNFEALGIISEIQFIDGLAKDYMRLISQEIQLLYRSDAITYSIKATYFKEIIDYIARNNLTKISLAEIYKLGPSPQGNHNKLCYAPWGLLLKVNRSTREVSDRLYRFYRNELHLPEKILVFKNGDSEPDFSAGEVLFADLPPK